MAGYGAVARLEPERVRPDRAVGPERVHVTRGVRLGRAVSEAPPTAAEPGPFEELYAIRAPSPEAIAARLARVRELWRQTTFYLFDADGWR